MNIDIIGNVIWVFMRENLSSGFANNKGVEQPEQHLYYSLIGKYYI